MSHRLGWITVLTIKMITGLGGFCKRVLHPENLKVLMFLVALTESMRAQSDATALASLQSDYAAKEAGARPEGVK